MDKKRGWVPKKTNSPLDLDVLSRAVKPDPTLSAERVLYSQFLRLLAIVGYLAAAYLLAIVITACASPTAKNPGGGAPGSSRAEPSAAVEPRFTQGGPDAEEYGAREAIRSASAERVSV